jgi:hypothetical protein
MALAHSPQVMLPSPSASSPMAKSRSRRAMSHWPLSCALSATWMCQVAVRGLVCQSAGAADQHGRRQRQHPPQAAPCAMCQAWRIASTGLATAPPGRAGHTFDAAGGQPLQHRLGCGAVARGQRGLQQHTGIGRLSLLGPVFAAPASAPGTSARTARGSALLPCGGWCRRAGARRQSARPVRLACAAALASPAALAAKARRSSSTSARPRSFSRASTSAGRPRSSRKSAWRPAGRHRAGPGPAPAEGGLGFGPVAAPLFGLRQAGQAHRRWAGSAWASAVPGAAQLAAAMARPVAASTCARQAAPISGGARACQAVATGAGAAVVGTHHLDGQLPGPGGRCRVRLAQHGGQVGQRGLELVVKLQHLRAQHAHRRRWVGQAAPTRAAARPACMADEARVAGGAHLVKAAAGPGHGGVQVLRPCAARPGAGPAVRGRRVAGAGRHTLEHLIIRTGGEGRGPGRSKGGTEPVRRLPTRQDRRGVRHGAHGSRAGGAADLDNAAATTAHQKSLCGRCQPIQLLPCVIAGPEGTSRLLMRVFPWQPGDAPSMGLTPHGASGSWPFTTSHPRTPMSKLLTALFLAAFAFSAQAASHAAAAPMKEAAAAPAAAKAEAAKPAASALPRRPPRRLPRSRLLPLPPPSKPFGFLRKGRRHAPALFLCARAA